MTIRWFVAAMHLLALGIGLGAIWARGRVLRSTFDAPGHNSLLYADNWLFLTKMCLFLVVVGREIWPMVTFIRWRMRLGRGEPSDTGRAPTFVWISSAQAILIVLIVIAATGVARGLGI